MKRRLLLVILILAGALFLRLYRTSDLLRFYYDQGRDALVIQRIFTTKTPVLVGPTTGLAGILRGPAFYYLLAPGYALGRGNPAVAAAWLQLINLVGLIFLYLFAAELFSPLVGLVTLIFVSYSYYFVSLSRWLSEPSLILTSVPLMLYGLLKIQKKQKVSFWYPVIALMLGLNLQFEIASEIWFIPLIIFFVLTRSLPRPSLKIFLLSVFIFLATLIPQVAFDLRHQGIMRQGIKAHFISGEKSFAYDSRLFQERLGIYLDAFADLLAEDHFWLSLLAFGFILSLPLINRGYLRRAYPFYYALFFIPLVILAFYVGNHGNFYKYYLIGLFPLFAVLLAAALVFFLTRPKGVFLSLAVIGFFLYKNSLLHYYFYSNDLKGDEHVSLGNQLQALDWIYQDAAGAPFNLSVYVPPVIPYAYDYLFSWYGQGRYGYQPTPGTKILYSLNEPDPARPDKIKDWLATHLNYGPVRLKVQFGGIQVIKRQSP